MLASTHVRYIFGSVECEKFWFLKEQISTLKIQSVLMYLLQLESLVLYIGLSPFLL